VSDLSLARDERELRLAQACVPREFWNLELSSIAMARISAWGGRKVSVAEQRFWCKTLLKQPRNQKCFIGSVGESAGLALATVLAHDMGFNKKKQQYDQTYRILSVDAQHLPIKRESGPGPGIIIVHNVLDKSPAERIMHVRDLLLRFPKTIRLVVIDGTRDPWGWTMNNLVLRPDICCLATKFSS